MVGRMKTWMEIAESPEYRSVVEDCRASCLWHMGDALHPRSAGQVEQVLSAIERYGNLDGFRRVGEIRKWLSPDSRPPCCGRSPALG